MFFGTDAITPERMGYPCMRYLFDESLGYHSFSTSVIKNSSILSAIHGQWRYNGQ